MLGHALLDTIAIGCAVSIIVVGWAAVEVRRSGFVQLEHLFRRSGRGFGPGAVVSLFVLLAAIASGIVADLPPRQALVQITRVFIVVAAAASAAIPLWNLCRWAMRRGFGIQQ